MTSLDRLPGVAEVAMQQGLLRRQDHPPAGGRKATTCTPFKYRDLGSMATVGRFRAVVSLHGLRVGGVLGWLTWAVVHLTFLTGFANRFSTIFHWVRTFLGRGRSQLAYSARFTKTRPSAPR